MNPGIVLSSVVIGLLVGMTGSGGGALMTPMLILLFSVKASTAISSDLVATLVMRPVGAAVHARGKTVNLHLVAWMSTGSVPAAFLGSWILHLLGRGSDAEGEVELALGAALLAGAAAMALRYLLDRKTGRTRNGSVSSEVVRPLPTLLIGGVGGLIVGITSVGAGSLMIVLLLFLYPRLGAGQLVGTDLTQAIPLTAAAALGALLFGNVALSVTGALIVGSVPGVIVGSMISSKAPERWVRPAIAFAILASGLKYVGMDTEQLGMSLGASMIIALAGAMLFARREHHRLRKLAEAVPDTAPSSPDRIQPAGPAPLDVTSNSRS